MRNEDTQANFISWYKDVFGFSNQIATALYDKQLLKDKQTISKFSDGKIDNVCCSLRRDSGLPIAEVAVTRLKLLSFWIRHKTKLAVRLV